MTQEASLPQYKKLEEKCLEMELEIKELKEKYLELEKQIPRKAKVKTKAKMKTEGANESQENQMFLLREKWIAKQQSLYPGDILAFKEHRGQFELLAHSCDETAVLKTIDELFENKILFDNDEIVFR